MSLIEPPGSIKAPAVSERFQTARSTLLMDRFMTQFIKIGGVGIITVVLGIFLFLLWQIIPLFRTAKVQELQSIQLPPSTYRVLALDEYAQLPILADERGRLTVVDAANGGILLTNAGFTETNAVFTCVSYNAVAQELIYGTDDGRFAIVKIGYRSEVRDGKRHVWAQPQPGPFTPIGKPGHPIRDISYGDAGDFKLAAALQEIGGRLELHVTSLSQQTTLFGSSEATGGRTYDLTSKIRGHPRKALVNDEANSVVVFNDLGEISYFHLIDEEFQLRQTFTPFAGLAEKSIASMDYLFGDVTLVLTSSEGVNRLFSLYVPAGGSQRMFGKTKEFDPLTSGAAFYARSLRNKAFLVGSGQNASLRFATTERTRWEQTMPFEATLAAIGTKYDGLAFLDADHRIHLYSLDDPHPEASVKAMFGKVWYEGANEPRYEWQSTGGSDEFEPKLSMIPLIVGTLKGTIYAMLFAVPIAFLAALYTSQFAHPRFRSVFKPAMEMMASLPSVVLGFLAALWLAPLLETRVPSILLMVIFLPLSAICWGSLWSALPARHRSLIRPGFEFAAFAPLFIAMVWMCWEMGPVIERGLFVITDPETGQRAGDFRLWWTQFTGADFQQRNSLVVGFAMGFAVIPIIFTIAEDSLSNVPGALKSGSLALGASRWQTALRIVLPTASAGIFSAVMVGLGRAVGETMIVVMATGNTPITDFNLFSGMRTLSANLAVELPEAPHHGTLYRTLFLGAMLLFLLTFSVNTVAEVLRQKLRERYKTI
ncbi:MAG TPA: ABC transporter permease subunit [Verrucomicrobiae bacterium]|nr:ABC transporter permease subunit [Verrucomicrobiae bacterium]